MNLIFDIGYNHGEFTEKCFELYPGSKVVAVEANASLVYAAKRDPRLHLVTAVASTIDGEYVNFFIEPSQDGISTASRRFMENSRFTQGSKHLPPKSANWMSLGKIITVSLDSLVKSHGVPDLIKVDVEGYEYEVLSGLTQKCGKICFEWHEEEYDVLLDIITHLQSLGYEHFGMIGYFDEGDIFEKVTYSNQGDPYLEEPKEYFTWEELKEEMDSFCTPTRRVNYGMMWCQ